MWPVPLAGLSTTQSTIQTQVRGYSCEMWAVVSHWFAWSVSLAQNRQTKQRQQLPRHSTRPESWTQTQTPSSTASTHGHCSWPFGDFSETVKRVEQTDLTFVLWCLERFEPRLTSETDWRKLKNQLFSVLNQFITLWKKRVSSSRDEVIGLSTDFYQTFINMFHFSPTE